MDDSKSNLTTIDSTMNTKFSSEQHIDMISFDSSKGFITVDSDNKLSTDSLNKEHFYNLLVKLNQNDKLELNDGSLLTSQFYLTQEELNSLLKPNEEPNSTNDLNIAYSTNLDCSELTPETTFSSIKIDNSQCQEICCLLKIDYSDFK